MPLAPHRVHLLGETPYAHEREALQFLIQEIPNRDPFELWGLLHLQDPSTGRLYEIDALVLGFNALYLIEIKSGPGTYTGDSLDWHRTVAGERTYSMDCPFQLANHKAKVLAGLLDRRTKRRPHVQALIFLSHPDTKVELRADGRTGVLTRDTVVKALTHHQFPNVDPNWRRPPIDRPQTRELVQALEQIGIRERKAKLAVGNYDLGEILGEGPTYQDRVATHQGAKTIKKRARIYLVPQQTSVEVRSTLRRAADREAQLLHEVREHPQILRFNDYVADAPLGPTVLLDDFEGGVRLDAFLRQNPDLGFSDRIEIVAQIGRALQFCHGKSILHGAISPEASLVRRDIQGRLETRLFNFQLGSSGERIEGTVHISSLTAQSWMAYQAPEVRQDPESRSVESDLFSLGAVAYFVLTGHAPAPDAAALDDRLSRDGHLDPRSADDSIPAGVANVVANATELQRHSRFDDVGEWVTLLEEEATSPEPIDARPTLADPLAAGKEELVDHDLRVLGVLGQGATSRVLRVALSPDDTELALKVSLGPEHDPRLREEAAALRALRSANIVECKDLRELGGRVCLLLALAGTETAQRRIAREGTIPLDYAIRWGEELLSALDTLEATDILHRDIKPANLGVGSIGKGAQRMVLFDFSLVKTDRHALDVGTAAYRDPFLSDRGAWDHAADRWSAAITLHELLTGVRPSWTGAAIDPASKLQLAAERFDPAVRDKLTSFFQRALARHVEQRFDRAREMEHAWAAAFVAQGEPTAPTSKRREEPAAPSDEEVRAIAVETPIEALPLSVRARNALDRAGVTRAEGLLRLAENQLSAIPGVGRAVQTEILELRRRWQALRPIVEPPPIPFFPGYAGDNLSVGASTLDDATRDALIEAGFRALANVARAPEDQISNLALRGGFSARALRKALDVEHRAAEERDHPTTLETWLLALLRPRGAHHARVLFGLDPAKKDDSSSRMALGASVTRTAEALGVTTAAVYIALGKSRVKWAEHPAIASLVSLVIGVVADAGGLMSLADAAVRLLGMLPHDRTQPANELRLRGAALVRIVTDLRDAADAPLVPVFRAVNDELWVAASPGYGAALRALGRRADELSARSPLASAAETREALTEAANDTPLASLPFDQLASLAARASTSAACSTRLELYPRGMPADRALELTAAILTGDMTTDDIRARVKERYPDAAAVPDRPELDGLLETHGLRWNGTDRFVRLGQISNTLHTRSTSLNRLPTALPSEPLGTSPEALAARDFDDALASAVERQQFRLLFVRADLADRAASELADRLHVDAQPLDALLIDAMFAVAKKRKIDERVIHEADREGPSGRTWSRLTKLAEEASDDLRKQLFPPSKPLLLTRPGLLARYRLKGFLEGLVEASKQDESAAIFVLQPWVDGPQTPAINGELPVPGMLPGQRLVVPKEWIRNRHNAAATRV